MSDPIKIAVVGGGYGAKVPLPAHVELDEFEPVAVWSRRPERAAELAGIDATFAHQTELRAFLSAGEDGGIDLARAAECGLW